MSSPEQNRWKLNMLQEQLGAQFDDPDTNPEDLPQYLEELASLKSKRERQSENINIATNESERKRLEEKLRETDVKIAALQEKVDFIRRRNEAVGQPKEMADYMIAEINYLKMAESYSSEISGLGEARSKIEDAKRTLLQLVKDSPDLVESIQPSLTSLEDRLKDIDQREKELKELEEISLAKQEVLSIARNAANNGGLRGTEPGRLDRLKKFFDEMDEPTEDILEDGKKKVVILDVKAVLDRLLKGNFDLKGTVQEGEDLEPLVDNNDVEELKARLTVIKSILLNQSSLLPMDEINALNKEALELSIKIEKLESSESEDDLVDVEEEQDLSDDTEGATDLEKFVADIEGRVNSLKTQVNDLKKELAGSGFQDGMKERFDKLSSEVDSLQEEIDSQSFDGDDVDSKLNYLDDLLGKVDDLLEEIEGDINKAGNKKEEEETEEQLTVEQIIDIVNQAIAAFDEDPEKYLADDDLRKKYRKAAEQLRDMDKSDDDDNLLESKGTLDKMRAFNEKVEEYQSKKREEDDLKTYRDILEADVSGDDGNEKRERKDRLKFPRLKRLWYGMRNVFSPDYRTSTLPTELKNLDGREQAIEEILTEAEKKNSSEEITGYSDLDTMIANFEESIDVLWFPKDYQEKRKGLIDKLKSFKERKAKIDQPEPAVPPEEEKDPALKEISDLLTEIQALLEAGKTGEKYGEIDEMIKKVEEKIKGYKGNFFATGESEKLDKIKRKKEELDKEDVGEGEEEKFNFDIT